jgi:hypothetical protein
MSPPQQRERPITGVIAIRPAHLRVVRPLKAGVGGRTGRGGAAAGRRPTIRADGIESLAKSFGACPVRADAAAAAVPPASAQPVPAAGPDDRSDDRIRNAQLARSPAAVPCPAAPSADGS